MLTGMLLRSRRRLVAIFVALGVHLLAWQMLGRARVAGDREPHVPERPPMRLLWLALPDRNPEPTSKRPQPQLAAAPSRAPSANPVPTAPVPFEPQAITVPSAPTPPVAGSAPEVAPAPLNLTLPRGTSGPWRRQSPALEDARSNTARATFESRIGAALAGNGKWTEERIDLDHIRFRRGNTCVTLQRSRAAQINPMARNAGDLPWLTRGEEPC
jgi:hypothetical protein